MKLVVAEVCMDVEIVHDVRGITSLYLVFDGVAHLILRDAETVFERSVVSFRRKSRDVVAVVRFEIFRVVRKDFVEFLLFDISACFNGHIDERPVLVAAHVVPVYIRFGVAIFARADDARASFAESSVVSGIRVG